MKIALIHKYLDLDEKEMKDEKGHVMTLYDVLRIATTMELQSDTEGGGSSAVETKMKNFDIFLKVKDAGKEGELELSAEDIVHLKPRLGKIFGTLIAAPTIRLLEGKSPYGDPKVPVVSKDNLPESALPVPGV